MYPLETRLAVNEIRRAINKNEISMIKNKDNTKNRTKRIKIIEI